MKNLFNRLRQFLYRSGFILNLRRVWLLIALWAVLANLAFQTNRDIFFRLSYLILIIVAVSLIWAFYSVQSFRLERHVVTPRSQVGRLAEELFNATSTGHLPKLWIELFDAGNLPGHPVSRVLSAMAPRTRYSWTVRSLCRLRGRFQLGPLAITSGDPFGLFVFQRTLPDTQRSIVVYPMTVDLPGFAPTLGQLRGGDARQQRTHFVTTNAAGAREYAPGDSFNRIHWPSSARHDRLIVKEFELDPTADVWILLDMEHGIHTGSWWEQSWYERELTDLWMQDRVVKLAPNTEEYAVTAAASVAKYYLDKQRAVGLSASNRAQAFAQPDRGERQLSRLLEMLSVVESDGNQPFASLLAQETARLSRSITLVLITPSSEPDWIRFAQDARRRGLHLLVVLIDASSFGIHTEFSTVVAELAASGITAYMIRQGDDLRAALTKGQRRAV
jgi:uncharacterized protein (DUF58 family)